MKRLNRYYEALRSVYNYFGLDDCNILYPLIDFRKSSWMLSLSYPEGKNQISYSQNGVEYEDRYVDFIERDDFTAVLIDGMECRYIGIFDNMRNRLWNMSTSGAEK